MYTSYVLSRNDRRRVYTSSNKKHYREPDLIRSRNENHLFRVFPLAVTCQDSGGSQNFTLIISTE